MVRWHRRRKRSKFFISDENRVILFMKINLDIRDFDLLTSDDKQDGQLSYEEFAAVMKGYNFFLSENSNL